MKRLYSNLENKYKSPSKKTLTSTGSNQAQDLTTKNNTHINSFTSLSNARSNSSSINILKTSYETRKSQRMSSIESQFSVCFYKLKPKISF